MGCSRNVYISQGTLPLGMGCCLCTPIALIYVQQYLTFDSLWDNVVQYVGCYHNCVYAVPHAKHYLTDGYIVTV